MCACCADNIAVNGDKVRVAVGGTPMDAFRFEGEDIEIPQGFASGAFFIEVRGVMVRVCLLRACSLCYHTH